MPELKLNFAQAKMNKDLDERIIPSGQYRDATNIQISTSDGSDVGSAQTLMGNTKIIDMFDGTDLAVPQTATVVATVASPETDRIYYFVSAGDKHNAVTYTDIQKDYIIEFNTDNQRFTYVFVDIYKTKKIIAANSATTYINVPAITASVNNTGIRIGMQIHGTATNNSGTTFTAPNGSSVANTATYQIYKHDNVTVTDIIWDSGNNRWKIYTSEAIAVSSSDVIYFEAPRVLKFYKNRAITGINILDGNIYWTDNNSEPKKINIERSIKGTGGTEYLVGGGIAGFASATTTSTYVPFTGDTDNFHTRLVKDVEGDGYLRVVTNPAKQKAVWVEESHVTVIKKGPTQPLELEMYRSITPRITASGSENALVTTMTVSGTSVFDGAEAGDSINLTFDGVVDYREGDILYFIDSTEYTTSLTPNFDVQAASVRVQITTSNVSDPDNLTASGFVGQILSIEDDVSVDEITWNVRRDAGEALFEFQFPRFSYRYKYQDGEYSTFAPWSEVAFLPDLYEYFPKKGFNLGMRNQLRSLKLKYYFYPLDIMPQDVVEIDILYKETNNPTVYTVKTIKPSDEHPMWPDLQAFPNDRGEFEVKTDLIHAVVPSNQLLRPWDNVPKRALAQEVSANRIIYANYVQNYDVLKDPIIQVSLHQNTDVQLDNDNYALPSVKSLRKYQVGVVFSDGYGRETPVLTSKEAMINVPKSACNKRNRINARLKSNTNIPYWAKYYSFYMKEISSEYYTLAMDRWYQAADGNIWLSFPSSERNKLDEEMFLVLKKAHGSNKAVTEKARYKILAIEGQAPDFIKTTRKHLGNLFDSGKTVIGNSTRGYPLQDNTFITCNESEFEDVFGDDFHMEAMNYDKLTMRLVGQNQVSNEYTITKVSKLSSSYKLKIEGKFEEDAAFVSTDDTYTNRIDDLSIDLIEHVVENKPEFDGRFFVKIYKDAVLEENVLNTSEDSLDYTVVASWGLRYLNNYAYTSGSYGANNEVKTEAKELLDSGLSSSNARHNHPTRYSHHAAYKWAGAASDSTSDLKDAQLPPKNTGNGLRAWDMREGSARALGDDTWTSGSGGSGFTPAAREFWIWMSGHEDFFIDAATAYSWTSMEENFDKLSGGGKDRPGNDYQTDVWSAGEVACGREFTLAFNTRGTKGSPSGQCSNTKYEKGQPSRGIWGGGSYMDISWTGMGPGQENTWTWPQPYAETLKEASIMSGGVRTAADSFMSTLVAPGTKFRFRRDPDEVVYTVEDFKDHPKGWHNTNIFKNGTSAYTGTWGIRNYKTWNPWQIREQHEGFNKRQRWTIKVTPQIGSGESGYNPIHGTISGATTDVAPLNHDATNQDVIEIVRLTSDLTGKKDNFTDNPAIWETEPKESVDVDIYYQVGGLIPIMLDETTNEEYIPIGSHFFSKNTSGVATKHTVTEWSKPRRITFTPALPANTSIADGEDIMFYKRNNYNLGINHNGNGSALTSGTTMTLHGHNRGYQHAIWKEYHLLDWNNCWVFFNGAESDRARDDFNQKQMDNGVKASTVLAEPVREEHRKHGLIWSGIFNSNSGVNDTNQFIMAEKITKDLNPVYGSIQKLHTRNTDLITLCEDKILKILANKDALFNADGNTNVTATDKVLGAATPYKGKYGISTNPESFVATPFQLYFADPMRGQICALSGEGVRSISDLGMKDYFNDLLKNYVWQVLGTYDDKKLEYNVTIKKKYGKGQIVPTMTTVSYNEKTKGWVSFKSFTPQEGISLNNEYYTFDGGQLYKHHDNDTRNNFYGTQYTSDITLIFSDPSSSVKSFGSLRYEGSKQKITALTSVNHAASFTGDASTNDGLATVAYTDDEYFNLEAQAGWYVDNVTTNLQKSQNIEFKNKEGKYYAPMSGLESGSTLKLGTNWNIEEFSVQGLGTASISHDDTDYGEAGEWVIQNNVSATYGSPNWDTGADGND